MPRRLSEDEKQLLTFLPTDGSAIGGYALMAQLQEAGWRSREIDHVTAELRKIGEIHVGRGGSGGSYRHVRNDRQALLDAIDEFAAEDTPCTRATLQDFMEWHPDYLEQVLDALLERGSITIGPGRRAAVARADALQDPIEDVTPTAVTDPDADDHDLLELIPEAAPISNTRLRNLLVTHHGWDDERYWETRKRLRQRGLVEVGRGRGGSLRRARSTGVVIHELPPEPEPRPAEQRDEETIWSALPENGDEVDLSVLQDRFAWPATRFFATLDQLVADQKIHWRNSKIKRLIPAPPEAAIPVVVDPPPPYRSPHTALYEFVHKRFSKNSLVHFLSLELCARRIADDVPWNDAFSDVVQSVCDELQRCGYVDAELFQHLRARFDRLHPEIDNLERYLLRAELR